jgi:cephalosporin-C deacetylase-like acetyl esterase
MWGPFPERTPLNPRRVGTLEKSDYVVEKIIFESRPQFYVTANLYRPKAPTGRRPAVISPPGHSRNGKASATYQRFHILMARQGFVVLTWDPVSQGERVQLFDPAAKVARAGVGSSEHGVLGRQCYLLGINLMQYRVWDAMRAIDYLETRDDVDPKRIACVGQSGGGMETLQLAPFETRLKAAIPVCAVSTFRHKTEGLLIADPEQILSGTLGYGIDHPELLSTVAPRALLIGSAIRDYVPIAGARSTYQEVKRIYSVLGATEKVGLAETDSKHSFNQELREAAATWLVRWLGNGSGRVHEEPVEIAKDEELHCTSTGQIAGSLGGENVLTLNKAYAEKILPRRKRPSRKAEVEAYRREIAERVREVTRVGSAAREDGIWVPTRVFGAESSAKGGVIVVAESGKDDPDVHRKIVDPLVRAGYRVVGIDVRGWGETSPHLPDKAERPDGAKVRFSWDTFFAYRALEMGRPLFGQRLRDLLAKAPEVGGRADWIVIGTGVGALLAAHAAVLEPRIGTAVTIRGLLSYRLLIDQPLHRQPFSSFLPGVIGAYDVRDLYAAVASRRLLVVNPEDPNRRPVETAVARKELNWTAQVYKAAGAAEAFSLHCKVGDTELSRLVVDWLRSQESQHA